MTRDPQDHSNPARRPMTPEEERVRRRRILATGIALAAFAALIFIVSLARLYANVRAGAAA